MSQISQNQEGLRYFLVNGQERRYGVAEEVARLHQSGQSLQVVGDGGLVGGHVGQEQLWFSLFEFCSVSVNVHKLFRTRVNYLSLASLHVRL